MLILVGALLVSFIFPIGTYFYLRNIHKDDPVYKKDCWDLLWNGLLLGFPVFGFSLICSILFNITGIGDKYPLVKLIFSNLVLKALSEELMKFLLANKIIKKNHAVISFLELMAYTTIAAIGFELMESVVYLFSANVGQILVRGITNMHASFGLIMGFLIATGYKKGWKHPILIGITAAVIVHGAYDLFLDEYFNDTDIGLLPLLIAFICLVINIVAIFFIRKNRNNPYYNEPLFPQEDAVPVEETAVEGSDNTDLE